MVVRIMPKSVSGPYRNGWPDDPEMRNWQDEVKAMSQVCTDYGVPHAIEVSRSGNGAHLWIFFTDKVPAREARLLGFSLLDKAMEIHPALSFDSYDCLFPNQDMMPEGGFGNLIALPLQREPRLSGNCSFADSNLLIYPDQWQYLAQLNTLPPSALNDLLIQISPSASHFNEQDVIKPSLPWEVTAKARPIELDNPPSEITFRDNHHISKSCLFQPQ